MRYHLKRSLRVHLIAAIALVALLPASAAKAQTAVIKATPVAATATIDLIVEANTYVPYFYQGRAVPTAGNSLRLVAVVDSAVAPTSFRWHIGSQYLSTTGPAVEVTFPILDSRTLVEVTALDSNNVALGRQAEYIETSQPKILFYEDNALRGTSRTAIQDGFILVGDETLLKAEPYFAGAAPSRLRATWSSTLPIEPQADDWRFAYLRRGEDGASEGRVELKIANPDNLNEYLSAAFNLSV